MKSLEHTLPTVTFAISKDTFKISFKDTESQRNSIHFKILNNLNLLKTQISSLVRKHWPSSVYLGKVELGQLAGSH